VAGKIAVITEAVVAGIGLATASASWRRRPRSDHWATRERAEGAAAFIKRTLTTVTGDVSRLEDLDRLYAVVKEKHGHIEYSFANAGRGYIAPLREWLPREILDQTFDVNVKDVPLRCKRPFPSSKTAARLS